MHLGPRFHTLGLDVWRPKDPTRLRVPKHVILLRLPYQKYSMQLTPAGFVVPYVPCCTSHSLTVLYVSTALAHRPHTVFWKQIDHLFSLMHLPILSNFALHLCVSPCERRRQDAHQLTAHPSSILASQEANHSCNVRRLSHALHRRSRADKVLNVGHCPRFIG